MHDQRALQAQPPERAGDQRYPAPLVDAHKLALHQRRVRERAQQVEDGARRRELDPRAGDVAHGAVMARRHQETDVRFDERALQGQVAEIQVFGTPAPNPDLTVTGTSFTPAGPVETDQITLTATVRNAGTATSTATDVTFFLGTTAVGTAQVGALQAGAQANVSTTIAARPEGSYQYTA